MSVKLFVRTLNDQLCKNQLNRICSNQLRLISTLNQDDDFSILPGGSALAQTPELPLLINRQLKHPEMYNPKITPPKEAWVESFTGSAQQKLAIVKLHPRIFSVFPRPDTVRRNLDWQNDVHWVNFLSVKVRNELSASHKKPWPQKGTGRARHGSRRAPQWKNGAWWSGPRGWFKSFFCSHFKSISF